MSILTTPEPARTGHLVGNTVSSVDGRRNTLNLIRRWLCKSVKRLFYLLKYVLNFVLRNIVNCFFPARWAIALLETRLCVCTLCSYIVIVFAIGEINILLLNFFAT